MESEESAGNEQWYTDESLKEVLRGIYSDYYGPISMKLQFEAIAYSFELHDAMIENYCTFAKLLAKQQEIYANKSSLIAHQLALCSRWKSMMFAMEQIVFSFATTSQILQTTRKQTFPEQVYIPGPSNRVYGEVIIDEEEDRRRYFMQFLALYFFRTAMKKLVQPILQLQNTSLQPVFYDIISHLNALSHELNKLIVLNSEKSRFPIGKCRLL